MTKGILPKMKNIFKIVSSIMIVTGFSLQAQETMIQTRGPEGIWTRSLALHPDGSIFASAQDGSFYHSSDQGDTWELKSVRGSFAETIVVTDSGHIFVGDSRVYKSTDMGETWEESNSGIPITSILSMLYNKVNGDIIVGTYEDGIYISHDMGTTWLEKNSGLTEFAGMRITSLYQHVDGDLYATGTNYSTGYIYRSTNHGEGWEVISGVIPDDKTFTDLTVTSDNRLFAVTWNGSVYRSDPGKEIFELVTTGLRPASYKSIAVLASDVLLVGAIFEGVYRSDSYGDIWVPQKGTGLYGPDCWDILYDESHDRTYISMKNAGIFISNGVGNSWEVKNSGLAHTEVDDIIITEDNTIIVGVSRGGVYRSYDGGGKWEWGSPDFEYSSVNALAYKPGYLFAGLSGSGVYISEDEGGSWRESGLDLTVGWVSALAIGSEGEIYAGLTTGIIHRSDDNGESWTPVYDAGDEIMDIILNPHSGFMFAAVDDNSTGGVHLSTDGGMSWSRQISGLGSNRVVSLAVSPVEDKIYASTANNGIYVSDVNGVSWEKPLSNGLPNWISSIAVNSKGEIFAGGNKIYSSRDGGENYTIFSEEPNSTSNAAFALDNSEVLYIATTDRSVWKSVAPTTARNIHFAVNMINVDGFEPSSQSVVVRGPFNEWGLAGDVVLTPASDGDLTYVGNLTVVDTTGVVVDGTIEYKYAVLPNDWELIEYNRTAEWDGVNDLFLDTVLFSNQNYFTRMNTSVITMGGTESRGVAWADYDNDGDEDVIITEALSSSKNNLYRNDGGVFTQITTGPVVTDNGDSQTACWGDYNNDGFVDLYVTNLGSDNNFLYKNNGDGGFTRISSNESVNYGGNSVGAVWADFNNDGYLDLFVTNSGGELNFLFMNDQDETFTRITGQSIVNDIGDSRASAAADYDNDGDIDVFVANAGDGENDVLYQNDGSGNFTGIYSGLVHDEKTVSSGGSWGDYNNDGWLDLYVSTSGGEPNKLYKNNQSGGFTRVNSAVMPADSSVSFGSGWMDYDNDGLLDLFVANIGGQRNFLYKQSEGGNFTHILDELLVETPSTNPRGAAWGDFNNDGFPDLVIGNNGGPNPLYRNNITGNHFLKIKLIGTQSNKSALGAKVLAYYKNTDGDLVAQRRDILSQTGFLGQNSTTLIFGLGKTTSLDSLIVFWPGGGKETLSNTVGIDQTLTITESNPLVPPPSPILSFPLNGSTDIILNPQINWNQAGDAAQYHVRFADNVTFNPLIIEDTVVTQAYYEISGLQYDHSYYWQIRAKNEAGWGPWSDVWSFTTGSFSGTLSEPTLKNPSNEQQGVPIPAPLSWTSEIPGLYTIQIATDDQFNNLVYNTTITDTVIFVDHSFLDYSTEYYWRVNVTISEEISPWSIPRFFTTQSNEVQASRNLVFPQHERRDEFASTDYLMVGIPGGSNALFRDIFTGDAGDEWMAYWDNGKTGNPTEYYVAYDGSNIFKFSPGKAFWIIHNGPVNIDKKIAAAPLNPMAQTEVVIQSGWNMITSPFEHRISWETVKRANNITADIKLWRYDRTNRKLIEYSHLEPMEGFYFDNPAAARTILLVPYIDSFSKPIIPHEVIWDLNIELTSGETRGTSARIGVAADAKISLDDFDFKKPHAFADLADIYFERPDWVQNNSRFGGDIRPEISEVEVWDFQVYTPQKNESRLTFPGLLSIPEDYDVYLIDKTRLTYQNLRDDDNYKFVSTTVYSNFEIIVGNAEAVEEQLESIIPMTYTLGQNYPNPFNPTTKIPLTLPEQSEMTLKVFNILGQEVVTIFNGTLNAGRHFFIWDGTNQVKSLMPSGIYIYQMTTNTGFRFTGKMVLIK